MRELFGQQVQSDIALEALVGEVRPRAQYQPGDRGQDNLSMLCHDHDRYFLLLVQFLLYLKKQFYLDQYL